MPYYIVRKGQRVGPFSVVDLAQQNLERHTLVWATGMQDWQRAETIAELQPLFSDLPPPLPANLESSAAPPEIQENAGLASKRRAWNPQWIAWCSLLFTPIWGGIVTAINARRLGINAPWYRPVGIAMTWVATDLFGGELIGDSWIAGVVTLCIAVFVLWAVDLEPQDKVFRARQFSSASAWGPWIVGSPLALLTIVGLIIAPLSPLDPKQVGERFMNADSEAELQQYSTPKLWPAMNVLLTYDNNTRIELVLAKKGEIAANLGGGYAVDFAAVYPAPQGTTLMAGELQLLQTDDEWKVNEVLVTHLGGKKFDPPLAFSSNAQGFLQSQREAPDGKDLQAKLMEAARKNTLSTWWEKATGSWKGFFGAVMVLTLIFGRFFSSRAKVDTHEKK